MKEFSGFYKKSIQERLEILKSKFSLSDEEIEILKNSGALSLETADRMIENVIGAIHLPVGLATSFVINNKPVLIPMAVEEPSVIAAASKAAKLTLPKGFTADADDPIMIGQIQLIPEKNKTKESLKILEKNKEKLLSLAKEFSKGMEKHGGGVKEIAFRTIETFRGDMILIEVSIDVRDAMGANTINTVLESISPEVSQLTNGETRLRILTNLAVKRKVRAQAIWKKDEIGEETIERMLDGYAFAKSDIFRCATNNKGIMNGIDAVAIATGNDWRAVEAGAHAYASMEGYKPLVHYEKTKEGDILGKIELPLSVGTVGGAINTKPTPKILFKIMGIKTAQELSMAMACVGLANNFAALRALSSEGIQKGHMKLHARNIAVLAGANTPEQIDKLSEVLSQEKNFSLEFAKQKLKEMK